MSPEDNVNQPIEKEHPRFLTADYQNDGTNKIRITYLKCADKKHHPNYILRHLGAIIQGAVWGTIFIVMCTTWIYCLCCRKKGRMTQEQKDKEQKEKWENNVRPYEN